MLAAAWYHTILAVLFAFLAVILMGLILLQRGRGVGLAGAFGGAGGHTAFGAKTGDVLTWATVVLTGILLLFVVILNYAFVAPTTVFGGPAITAPGGDTSAVPAPVTPAAPPTSRPAAPVPTPTPAPAGLPGTPPVTPANSTPPAPEGGTPAAPATGAPATGTPPTPTTAPAGGGNAPMENADSVGG